MEAKALTEYLLKAAELEKNAHAYILEGEKSITFPVAESFGKALIKSPADLILPEHEKPNLFSVEDVRETIAKTVHIRPYGSGKKVYIVTDADKMNVQAQNALLKTIEEPPEYVVIILLAVNAEVFLETILSRCQRLAVYGEGGDDTAGGEGIALLKTLLKTRTGLSAREIQNVSEELKGLDPASALEYLRQRLRDVLYVKAGQPVQKLYEPEEFSTTKAFADKLSYEGINRVIEAIDQGEGRLKANVNPSLAVEMILYKLQEEL